MYLLRAALVRVGNDNARFDPVELRFADDRDEPVSSGVLLFNGGVKTTLLSLLFAVLDPDPRRFIAHLRRNSYQMGQYLRRGEPGHVILEWAIPDGRGRHVKKVTGLVMTRTDSGTPQRRVYGFRSADSLTFDTLPTGTDEGKALSVNSFVGHLRDHRTAANNLYAEPQTGHRWRAWLTDERIDPDLIDLQIRMNAEESGAASLLAGMPDVWAFTRRILELTVDPQQSRSVLATVAELHRAHEAASGQRAELAALTALLDPLENAAVASELAYEHRGRLSRARTDAATTIGAVAAAADRVAEDAAAALAHERKAAEDGQALDTPLRVAERHAAWAQRRAYELDVDEAQKAHRAALGESEELAQTMAAWQLVDNVLDLRVARSRLAAVEEELAEVEDVAAPARRRAAGLADLTAAVLSRHRTELLGQARTAKKAAEAATAEAIGHSTTMSDMAGTISALRQRLSAAEARRTELTGLITEAVEQGRLPDSDVQGAAAAHRQRDTDIEERRSQALAARSEATGTERQLAGTAKHAETEHARTVHELEDAEKTLAGLHRTLRDALQDPLIGSWVEGGTEELARDLTALSRRAVTTLQGLEHERAELGTRLKALEEELATLGKGVRTDTDVVAVASLLRRRRHWRGARLGIHRRHRSRPRNLCAHPPRPRQRCRPYGPCVARFHPRAADRHACRPCGRCQPRSRNTSRPTRLGADARPDPLRPAGRRGEADRHRPRSGPVQRAPERARGGPVCGKDHRVPAAGPGACPRRDPCGRTGC